MLGKWKGTNKNKKKFEIIFKRKSLSITPIGGAKKTISYKQIGIGIGSGNQSFLLRMTEGKDYWMTIPNKENPKIALIEFEAGNETKRPLFALCKDSFLNLEELEPLLNL